MDAQTPPVEEIPLEIIQQILQDHVGDNKAVITTFEAELMSHEGFGGNILWRASVAWQVADEFVSATWIIKRWRPGGLVGRSLGVTQPSEALAWSHGITQVQAPPVGLETPYIGVHINKGEASAWIVMADISNELALFRAPEALPTKIEKLKFMLDRLAQFHIYWEQPEGLASLREHSWLLPQERYLWAGAEGNAIWLGRKKVPHTAIRPEEEPVINFLQKGTLDFLAWLPQAIRPLWEDNMCDRQALVEAFSGLPQTLYHGDLAWNNLGLRWETDQKALLPIDWELIGLGSPAMDVARLIILTLDLRGNLSAGTLSLPEYYFERYLAQGGTQYNAESWQKAYELATIFCNLWQFPWWAGWTVGEDPNTPDHLLRDIEMIRQKTEQTTALMRKWLD